MSDDSARPPPRRRARSARVVVGLFAALVLLVAGALLLADTPYGHRLIADGIASLRPSNGLCYRVGQIEGSVYGRATLIDVEVSDLDGVLLRVPRARLDWRPLAWLDNRLDIAALDLPEATLLHLPHTRASENRGPILPGFDLRLGRLHVARLTLAKAVTGTERVGRIEASADLHDRRALVRLAADVAGSDRVRLLLDAAPDADRFDIALRADGSAQGLLARLIGVARPVAAAVRGRGSWRDWRGAATVDLGTARVADLALTNVLGRYTLSGTLDARSLASGRVARLTSPRVLVNGAATLAHRVLTGSASMRSAAVALDVDGALDLAARALRKVRVHAVLLRPPALFPNMTGRAIDLRALLDGPFATARFDYRVAAQRFAFDRTGFEDAHASGSGHFSRAPVLVPLRFTAARVTGVGDVAGGILRRLSLDGVLRVTPRLVTGDGLRLRSDKLSGEIGVLLDLRAGTYSVGIEGGLGPFLIPGLGVVDVTSRLRVVPGAGGHGTRIVGTGEARMDRLDNAFFRSLAGGLPRVTTNLERTADGVLHFTDLVLTAPDIRIAGTGLRRRDGTIAFAGAGTQRMYGALTLKLDGRIEKPTIGLTFQRPNATLALRDVAAHLAPTPAGFAFVARGGSALGAFAGTGAILLPPGGTGSIVVSDLAVAGTHAAGALRIVDGGFDGRLTLAGGGVSGDLAFDPVAGHQRIAVALAADGARFPNRVTLRRGRLDATLLLDPAGTAIDASLTAAGLRRASLTIGRIAAHAALRGQSGRVTASFAGTRGRGFDIQSMTEVTPDRFVTSAQGTVDRRPLRLLAPAVVARDGAGWRLDPVRLAFAGGEARVGGRFGGGGASTIEVALARMPLAVLDIGYPGLALGGAASGTLSFAQGPGAAPSGRVDLTVKGLTRSGLVLSSRPVDVGVAAVLDPAKLAARAVAVSEAKTVGRAQMLLALGPGPDLAARVAGAGLFAQLRYDGPADTLWRLTGVSLFDLSGPVQIAADVGGRVRDPQLRGIVRANGARIESATTGTVLTNVVTSGRFAGSRLAIDRFAADAGKGGRVTGTGTFDFAARNGIGLDLALDAKAAQMIARDDLAATVTGALRFRSDGAGGTISGDLVLDRSRYRLGQATAATALPQLDIREINLPGGGEEDDAPRAPWTLAIHARAPNQVLVTGLGLRSEWSADLSIGGTPDNPAITGHADLVRGDYTFAGRNFELARGKILFAGEVPANPSLDIAANADTTGLSAVIRVTGPASKPEIAFTSTPALPQDELLSRLLFGTSITNLSAPEALQLAAAVAALRSGNGGLSPINAVRRVAGLDRLRILPADKQTGAGTSVAVGKYITRRFYAEIITDGAGYSATQVEFQVTRWLSLLSTISTIGRQSGNVRVSKDY